MYNCFGCDAQGDFIKFHMRKHGVAFPDAIKELCREAGVQAVKPVIVKTYDYIDANGNFVSQTVRYNPKKFSQRTKKNGEWIWSLEGIKTVLYNLAAVIKAKQVFVMEGEKDCDTANELGYTATTNPMGAGKWRDDYNPYLFGKEIILFPDNDQVGIKHMIQIGNALKDK
jgi:DNA primase